MRVIVSVMHKALKEVEAGVERGAFALRWKTNIDERRGRANVMPGSEIGKTLFKSDALPTSPLIRHKRAPAF